EKGKAPKVSVDLPFVYTIYAEATDRIDAANRRSTVGLHSEYQVTGSAVSEADYAQMDISVSAKCIVSKDKAEAAIAATSKDIEKALIAYHGGKQSTEKDRVTVLTPGAP